MTMMPAVTIPADPRLAEAAAAHADLAALMQQRRGLGLDLPSLLTLRHLSRLCSFRCGEPACAERAVELEARAAELYAQGQQPSAEGIAFLERRIRKLLGQIEAYLARRAS